jgi:hypothetical protein
MVGTVNVGGGPTIRPELGQDLVLMRASRFTGAFFNVSGAVLELQGNGGNLVLDGNKGNVTAPTAAPLVTVGASGLLTMDNGVCLKNNHNSADGGAVMLNGGGSLTMTGGTITGNESGARGGGVILYNACNITIGPGSFITYNIARDDGGGVSMSDAILTMNGGTISYNRAGLDHDGGGVAVYGTTSVFSMNGGNISYNQVSSSGLSVGAGVYFDDGTLNVAVPGSIRNNDQAATKGDLYKVSGSWSVDPSAIGVEY